MNLRAARVITLRDAGTKLLNDLWFSRAHHTGQRVRRPKDYAPAEQVEKYPALDVQDLPSVRLRELFSILHRWLSGDKFTEQDNVLLKRCLSLPIKSLILANLLEGHLTCHYFAKAERVCAESLVRYFEVIMSDKTLLKSQPLGLCKCGRIFLKARRSQKFCSPQCQTTTWQKEHPDYWRKDNSLLLERKKKKGRKHNRK